MSDSASMIDAAQHAVAGGDYEAAERLLREAAATQESTLGSAHPDLATTLNNLAFVCERNGKVDEAERGYRRAHAIAVASLSPGHPFIKTSLSNLVEFCEARGIPLWTRPVTPIEDEPLPDEVGAELSPTAAIAPAVEQPVLTRRQPFRMIAAAAIVIAAIVVIIVVAGRPGSSPVPNPGSIRALKPGPIPAPEPRSKPAPEPGSRPALKPGPSPEPSPQAGLASSGRGEVTVLKSQLCSALEKSGSPDWQCAPLSGDVPPGTYTFYTRLLTTSETTVEHRWYRDGRVHQTMRLRVSASPGSGYRTFSVTTVSPERGGEWKVELRGADGSLLDEKSFRVR